ncbi:MAG: hypothetical protein RB294_10880 [Bacteroidales bacterium]|jgi:hypothetical protein|nr:hypothetical protein [Bacteroidales bacterium]
MNCKNFAEFHSACEKRKRQILMMDVTKPRFMYNVNAAISCLSNFYLNAENAEIIDNGIAALNASECSSAKSRIIRDNSIGILNDFKNLNIKRPLLTNPVFEIGCKKKQFFVHTLQVSVSPNAVFYVEKEDGLHAGGILFRTTKAGSFDFENCKIVALILEQYLKKAFSSTFFKVDKDLCFCIDPHNNCWASSPHDEALYNEIIEETYAMITSQNISAA